MIFILFFCSFSFHSVSVDHDLNHLLSAWNSLLPKFDCKINFNSHIGSTSEFWENHIDLFRFFFSVFVFIADGFCQAKGKTKDRSLKSFCLFYWNKAVFCIVQIQLWCKNFQKIQLKLVVTLVFLRLVSFVFGKNRL